MRLVLVFVPALAILFLGTILWEEEPVAILGAPMTSEIVSRSLSDRASDEDQVAGPSSTVPHAGHASALVKALAIRAKAIHSARERRELQTLLADDGFLQWLGDRVASGASLLSRDAQKEHLRELDLLIRALEWEFNPESESAVTLVESILERDDWRVGPIENRRLAAGDRVELYRALKRLHPTRAEIVLARVDERTRRLFSHSR